MIHQETKKNNLCIYGKDNYYMKNKNFFLLFSLALCVLLSACSVVPDETTPAATTVGSVPEVTPESTPESTPEEIPESTPESTPEETPESTPCENELDEKEEVLIRIEEVYNSSDSNPEFKGITYIGEFENGCAVIIFHDRMTNWAIVGFPRKIGDHIFTNYWQYKRVFIYDGEAIKELSVAYEKGLISNEELADIYAFCENRYK